MEIEKKVLNSVHSKAVFQRRVRTLSKHLADQITGGETVLDVGCGDGTIATSIQQHKPNVSFSGIDVFLRPNVAIPAKAYDGKTIPHEDNSFDWVTIVDVLHHTDDPAHVLAECARVASRGVIIKDHLRNGIAAFSTLRFMDWVGNKGHDVRLPYNYLSKNEWQKIFADLNMHSQGWNKCADLYPLPFNLLFGRNLHFITTLVAND